MNPEVFVLDEPTVGLDRNASLMIHEIMRGFHHQERSVVFVSHDMDLVAQMAPRVLVLNQGRVLFDGSRTELFQNEAILEKAGLVIPQICRFMHSVKKQGYPIRTDVFSVKEAKQELKRVMGRSK
jgi:energy-coupling factor transport system ATP-binding protein